MKQETERLIIEKAKFKDNGCYRFRGAAYRVREGSVTHFAYDNKVFERCFGMNCQIGNYVTLSHFDLDKKGQEVLLKI